MPLTGFLPPSNPLSIPSHPRPPPSPFAPSLPPTPRHPPPPQHTLQHEIRHELDQAKAFLPGTDRDGRPLCVVVVSRHEMKDADASKRYIAYSLDCAVAMGANVRRRVGGGGGGGGGGQGGGVGHHGRRAGSWVEERERE